MYEELVKRLRESVGNRDEKCDCCPYEEDYPCCVDCLDKMHREAADAIEELSRVAEVNAKRAMKWAFDAEEAEAKLRWIPVTEPPNNMRDVLVTVFWHENWQTLMGWYDGKWHVTANDQVREGLTVIAWQDKPLPAPHQPKCRRWQKGFADGDKT